VNGYQQGFRFLANFGFGGQNSASKPPQAICKTLPLMLKIRLRIKNSFINLENVTFLGNFGLNLTTDQIERI